MKRLIFHRRNYYVALIACALLYTSLTLLGPRGPNTYNLTLTQLRLVQLTVIVPVLFIWAAAFFGALWFKAYATSIRKSPDGHALLHVSKGLVILVSGLVISSLFGTLRQTMINSGNAATFGIARHYLSIGFAFAAFYVLYQGSKKLLIVKHISGPSKRTLVLALGGLFIVSLAYTFILLRTPYRNHTPDPQKFNSYFMPDWLIVLTIILPYVLSWIFGVLAALNIWSYRAHTNGIIYKASFSNIVKGVLAVTFFSIALQFFTALATSLQNLGLGSILIIVYIILILYAVGYLLIASGAKKLARIEEV